MFLQGKNRDWFAQREESDAAAAAARMGPPFGYGETESEATLHSARMGEGCCRSYIEHNSLKLCSRIRSVRNGVAMKICSRCKVEKPLSGFTTRRLSKDGFTSACTACLNATKRTDYKADPKKTIERASRNQKQRLSRDPAWRNAWNAWRRSKKENRVPKWVNFTRDILPIYRATKALGVDWVVDHIIPLNAKWVCGLHVPQNLQPLPHDLNGLKSDTEVDLEKADAWRDLHLQTGRLLLKYE